VHIVTTVRRCKEDCRTTSARGIYSASTPHVSCSTGDAFATGKALFRQYEQFSFVDACIVAYMQAEGLGYLYAFDDDFDAAEDVSRLNTAINPYDPE